jgi:hypothetical protein
MKHWCDGIRVSHRAVSSFLLCASFLPQGRFEHFAAQRALQQRSAMPVRRRRAPTPRIVGDAHPSDDLDILPPTTKWYRDHGRRTRREKAAKEQYLTPNEEKGLAAYVLRMSKHGFPLPVKVLRSLAPVIRQRRIRGTSPAVVVQPPGKN